MQAWAERVAALRDGPGLRIGVAAHSVRAVPRAALPVVAEVADGRPLHVHLSEQPAENAACLAAHRLTPTGLLAAEGLLGPATTAVHATHLTAADVALLVGSGTTVCLCPTTEADLADGIGPARALRDAGCPLALGGDQHALSDPFAEARGLEMHERLATGERGRFTPAALLEALTAHGAIGLPDAGRLEPGAPADLVAVRLDTPRTAGSDPAQVMLTASGADVDTVVVDGRRRRQRRPARARRRRRDAAGRHRALVGGPVSSVVVTGIGELTTHDPDLGTLHGAAVVAEAGAITWVGSAAHAPAADRRIDVGGRAVVPGFVDSHTHLVFAGDRAAEFAARMRGERYDGGGIASTVAATRAADDATLRALLAARVAECRAQGTTTVEIKSGYGLTVADEERALRLAAEVTSEVTFLGAHVVPAGAARDDYVALVTGPMLAACAPHARWIDVFCEPASPHAFDGDEARAVLEAGRAAGLELRVHGNQLGPGPGVALAVELGAASVDHCTYLTDADVDALAGRRHRRHPAARRRVLHPLALPGRPPAARRGRRGRARVGLQPGYVRLVVDAADDRAGRPGDGPDAGRGAVRGHRGRGAGAAAHGRRRARAREPRRPHGDRRPEPPAPRLPPGRPARPRARPDARRPPMTGGECSMVALQRSECSKATMLHSHAGRGRKRRSGAAVVPHDQPR